MEKLAAVDKSQYKIELFWRLKGKFEWNNEGVVDLGED